MAGVSDAGPDATIALILTDIEENRLDVALSRTENLISLYPNFRLAHLIRGDLLLARAQPLQTLGNVKGSDVRLNELRAEASARLNGYLKRPESNQVPRYLLQMNPEQQYAVVVDTRQSRLYLYRNTNGRPSLVADWYASQGRGGSEKQREGDLKTPIGVYYVTSMLPRKKLPDYYGNRAFPINYPNEWDRMQGRTGYGIWLHGVPSDTYARAPLASEGCVVLSNQDLDTLTRYVQIGVTPVIISNGVEWASLDDWQVERKALSDSIEQWRRDWANRDTERYLSHYSKRFLAGKTDLTAWRQQKQAANASKAWIKVELNGLTVLRSPGNEELVMVSFEQDYRSNNLNDRMRKRQYWIREDGNWKIIYEGAA
ncbi:MAG: hypothetical protein CGU28_09575 [Candidatus Dactylopiibacterium carminicum]|uniref:L,D-TPase catalytic domain-containing protein n=2 Tax=Candidatus Dactylopiibacterium carminicum TaxID=857335 RepID=A0A272ERV6_9RHOO|nr:hypothetical protein BGI27_10765 [Candidatus Dactylopiibacterium carminicum]PAS92825.1 MAG: hypothetical protein CGU29_10165 [Candidatus Dactylopiibacterium carminicum]PAS96277.1 MAG: hypothetical protein CGU28_09575 [Candidatus Dactylopiibacterium carminicum]